MVNACADLKRRHTAPAEVVEQAVQGICPPRISLHDGNQVTQPGSRALVPASMGSKGHQTWAAHAAAPSGQWTGHDLSLPIIVEKPLSQPTWLQFGADGDPSSDNVSICNQLNGDGPMKLAAASDGLGDTADSQQLVAGEKQVRAIQRHVQPAVYLFVAKMLMRSWLDQHGAAAPSPAQKNSDRTWQLAVLARFAHRPAVDLWGNVVTRQEEDGLLIPNISVEDLVDVHMGQLYYQ